MKYIPEINLQWQYGFFPKLLNTMDSLGNFFYLNLMEKFATIGKDAPKNPSKYEALLLNKTKTSALYKIVRNNFAVVSDNGQEMSPKDSQTLREEIMQCVNVQIGINLGVEKDIAPETATAGVTEEDKTDLLRESTLETINTYLKDYHRQSLKHLAHLKYYFQYPHLHQLSYKQLNRYRELLHLY